MFVSGNLSHQRHFNWEIVEKTTTEYSVLSPGHMCMIDGVLRSVNYTDVIRQHYQTIKESSVNYQTINEIPASFGFQPEIDCEFPSSQGTQSRIPRIIHQVWLTSPDAGSVPTKFIDNVNSFLKHNPNWTYFFWTNAMVRALLNERYPELLPLYDSFNEIVVKGDMVRYILLYEFGGVYADFDVVCHRPLDIVITKYPCMLVPEPFEHAVLWYQSSFVVINAIMMCKPKHPFLKQIVDSLPSRKRIPGIVHKLGPGFLTEQYKKYISNTKHPSLIDTDQNSTTPYFYKGLFPDTDDNGIYIPNTRFFMDSPSPALMQAVEKTCKNAKDEPPTLRNRMCQVVKARGYKRAPGKFTFLEHQWTHTWSNQKKRDKYEFINIQNLSANFKNLYTYI